LVVEG
jgi:hypothetical protein